MKWGLWSVTAASNSATPPDGWPEGQAPSTVNDCAREMMAQIRTGINNIQFVDLGVTPTETGNTTFTLAGNQMQWYPYGNRVQANVGGTLLYGTVISSTFTTNTGVTLRFDLGQGTVLTNSLSAVATGFPSAVNNAIPEVVFRRRNMLINSCMDIWQRGNGPYGLSGGPIRSYGPDRWSIVGSLTSGASLNMSRFERSASASFVPTVGQAGLLITNALGISVSAAMATLNTGSFLKIAQPVEGYTWRQLAQKPTTLSFWVNSRQTGTYCVALQNAGQDQSIVMQYSISSVATWEKKTISFPKSPAAGTWDYSNGVGVNVCFTLACGATFQGGAGNWTAANILATSAQTNFMTSAGNVLLITALQLEEGNQATPIEPVVFPEESQRVQRYCQVLQSGPLYPGILNDNNSCMYSTILMNQPMRAPLSANLPSISNVKMIGSALGGISVSAVNTTAVSNLAFTFILAWVGSPAGLLAGQGGWWQLSAGVSMVLDAEL